MSSRKTVRGFLRGGVLVGHVDPQRNLYTCDNQYLKWCLCGTLRIVGEDTFYGFLAWHEPALFRDDDFSPLYTTNNGRVSVPPVCVRPRTGRPSILAKAPSACCYN